MPGRFDDFLHRENIKNFQSRIEVEADPDRVAVLKTMLEQEKAKGPGKPVAR